MIFLSEILIGLGLFICMISILGLIRFPDVYTRLHAGTKATTLGSILIVAGAIVSFLPGLDEKEFTVMMHAILGVMLILFTNPISAHAIARAAMISGVKPALAEIDEYNSPSKKEEKESEDLEEVEEK